GCVQSPGTGSLWSPVDPFAGTVKFKQLAQQFIVLTQVVLNQTGYYLSDCVWSLNECEEGSDKCNCVRLFDAFERYFTVQEVKHVVTPNRCVEKARCQCKASKH
ncbi:hypothetical protein NPIL_276641, partial [Nephila pilipes]